MYVVIESRDVPTTTVNELSKNAADKEIVDRFASHGVDAIILPPGYRMSYGGVFVTTAEDPNRPADEPRRPT